MSTAVRHSDPGLQAEGTGGGPLLAATLTIVAALCWPLQEFTGGMLIRNHSMVQVVALRYVAHLLLLLLIVPFVGRAGFSSDRKLLQLLRGLCMFGMPAGYIMSRGYISNGWAWMVFWLATAGAIAIAALILREPGAGRGWIPLALLVASVWAVLDVAPEGLLGSLLAGVMGVSFAGYLILSRILRTERLPASLLYTALGALIPMLIPAMLAWTPLDWRDMVPMLLTGALSLMILGAFDVALGLGTLWVVGGMLSLVIVFEVSVQRVAYGTPVFTLDYVGLALALLAAIYCVRRARAANSVSGVRQSSDSDSAGRLRW